MFINDESVNAFNLTGSPAIIKTFFFFILDAADKTLHQDQQSNIYSAKTNRKLHPSSQSLVPFSVGVVGVGEWSLSQLSCGERRGTPWASRQSITRLTKKDRRSFTPTFTPMTNLETPHNTVNTSLGCGRKPEADTRRTCKLYTERTPAGRWGQAALSIVPLLHPANRKLSRLLDS